MSHKERHNHYSDETVTGGEGPQPYWMRAHHDWKFWTALSMMLIAMFVYIMTLDLAVRPAGPNQENMGQPVP